MTNEFVFFNSSRFSFGTESDDVIKVKQNICHGADCFFRVARIVPHGTTRTQRDHKSPLHPPSTQYQASMTPTPESKSSYGRPAKLCLSKSKKVANGSSGSVDSVDSSSSACSSSTEPTRASTRFRSNSIPVRKYIHKTPSELQLYEDEALADQRDHCMFSRIVSGIIRHQMSRQTDLEVRYQYDETLTNIIRTRHELDDCTNSARGVMPSSDQGFDFDDNDWAPNLAELNGHDEGIFFLEL